MELLPEAKLHLLKKTLGLTFAMSEVDYGVHLNYQEKIKDIEKLLRNWVFRNLTLMGKIIVVKSLAIPKLVNLFPMLPNPTDNQLKTMMSLIYKFIWNNKPDKISRKTLVADFKEGGLRMCDIPSFVSSLKVTWVKTILDPNYKSDWKTLLLSHTLLYQISFWHLNKASFNVLLSKTTNPFWKDVVKSCGDLIGNPTEVKDFLDQPLWNNAFIQVAGKPIYWKDWDLIDDNGTFLPFSVFQKKIQQTKYKFYKLLQHTKCYSQTML